MRDDRVPCLIGPTGSGKTPVGVLAARATGGEVIACDAFAVYRGMAILAAAPEAPPDVPHHLVGSVDPSESFSAARFVEAADALVLACRASGRRPWIVGGTALYLRSWLKGLGPRVPRDEAFRAELKGRAAAEGVESLHRLLREADPVRAAEVHPHDERRLVRALEIVRATGLPASAMRSEWSGPDRVPAVLVGLGRSPEDLDRRIRARTEAMFRAGVQDEVRLLLARPLSPEARKALGLEEVEAVLAGSLARDEAIERLVARTRRFARKQGTFFRSFDGVRWLDVAADEPDEHVAARVLAVASS